MVEYAKSAFQNLGRKQVRTILTILGIAIGVAFVIIIADISQSGSNAITGEMDSLGLSGLTVTASGNDRGITLNEDDLNLIKKMKPVEQAAPILMQNTKIAVKNIDTKAILWGIDSNASDIISLQPIYGRLFNKNDVNSCADVCLVDEKFSMNAYSRKNIVGKKVSVLCGGIQQEFTVIGIIKTGTGLLQNIIGNYIPTFVYVPYSTVQAAVKKDTFDQIAVKIKPGDDTENSGKMIVKRLNAANGTEDGYVSNDLAKQKKGLTNIFNTVTLVLSAVGTVALLVAGLSIMTMMLVSVNERTREIGIKKALGATRGAIMIEFLFEAVLISFIGCVIGIAIGSGVSWLISQYFHSAFSVRTDIILMSAGFALSTGTIFGVYPAYQASRLKPVDALRQE